MNDRTFSLAALAINTILDGHPPGPVDPADLGRFETCYRQMLRAHADSGAEEAWLVFIRHANADQALVDLRNRHVERRRDESHAWTAGELLYTALPEPGWAVRDLLPEGLVFLAGRPKLGKSWLALQFAVAVGTGAQVLDRPATPGRALYLALEDGAVRLQSRLRRLQVPDDANVDFHFNWAPLTAQGIANLLEVIDRHAYSLVVMDTMSRALGRVDGMDQASIIVTLAALQRIALARKTTLLLVDHHRKRSSGHTADVVDDLMGATTKAAVADATLGLYRTRGKRSAILKVAGRDVDDQELAICFDHVQCRWQYAGDATTGHANTVQADIIRALQELGGTATTTKLARWLGKQPPNVSAELAELVAKGKVVRGRKQGREIPYSLVPDKEARTEVRPGRVEGES